MAGNKFNHFFAATAALLVVIAAQSPPAEARKFIGVNPFCRTASYRKLCTEMVKGANNWHDASVNAMRSAMELANKIKGLAPPLNPGEDPLSPVGSVKQICKEDLEGRVSDLEESLEALEANDIGTVASHLSAALRTDCKDAMKESGMYFPVGKYLGHLTRNVDNCLAVVMQN